MSLYPIFDGTEPALAAVQCLSLPPWYAVQTRGRHEKKVTAQLEEKQFEIFLPLHEEVHRWSDRRKKVMLPLFPGYTFVRIPPEGAARLRVLQTAGVVRIVGTEAGGTPVPDEQIASIRRVVNEKMPVISHGGLCSGQRVRIVNGALAGTEGVLQDDTSGPRLVISVEAIHRSIAVTLTNYDVEPV
jgi:transcriptional antiterminator NusG